MLTQQTWATVGWARAAAGDHIPTFNFHTWNIPEPLKNLDEKQNFIHIKINHFDLKTLE